MIIRNTKIMFPHRLLSEYSSEEQKLRELSERVLHFERKDPTQWIVQVFNFVFPTFLRHSMLKKTVVFSHFGGTKNRTLGARIKIPRPLFNTNYPQKPQKRHLRNQNRTSKSDFWPFFQFCIFSHHFPISMDRFFFFKWFLRYRLKVYKF